MRWSAMPLEAQNRRKTAYFIASCGRAYMLYCQTTQTDNITHDYVPALASNSSEANVYISPFREVETCSSIDLSGNL